MWTDYCYKKEHYCLHKKDWYRSRFSPVPFSAWKKGRSRSNSSQSLHCPVLIVGLAGALAVSAQADCRQGPLFSSDATHCQCRAQPWLPSCLLRVPLSCCWSPFGSWNQVMSYVYFPDDVEGKELTLQIYTWFGQECYKAWHLCSLITPVTGVLTIAECG